MTSGVPSLDDLTNALAPINRDFHIWDRLLGLLLECFVGKVILRNLQFIGGLSFLTMKDQG